MHKLIIAATITFVIALLTCIIVVVAGLPTLVTLALFCAGYTFLVEATNVAFPGHDFTYWFVCVGVGAVLVALLPVQGWDTIAETLLYFIVAGVIMGVGNTACHLYLRSRIEEELDHRDEG